MDGRDKVKGLSFLNLAGQNSLELMQGKEDLCRWALCVERVVLSCTCLMRDNVVRLKLL